ncbi:hypothetical protein LTS15_004613 [Exophiala xenobiotica]|nr:hypothetical protein LTS15_004613 [Exophiala xenobiotica]
MADTNGTSNGFANDVSNGVPHGDPAPTTQPGNLYTEKISEKYHNDGKGYYIPMTTYKDPANRKLKVITIGAGFSGVMLAYRLEKECKNIEHKIFEKNPSCGGTWVWWPRCPEENILDATADWSRFRSASAEIKQYIETVVDKLDLRKYMTFNSEVIEARFNAELGVWNLKIAQKQADGTKNVIHEQCDLLIGATGLLDHWEIPPIPGIEKFKGRVVHTAGQVSIMLDL